MSIISSLIKINSISIVYKEHHKSPFSRVVQLYYKAFLRIFRISAYYDSYSQADAAPVCLKFLVNKLDYKVKTIWREY